MRRLRKRAGLTQQQLADLIGVSGKSVLNWERGRRVPDGEVLLRIREVLGWSADDVLDGLPKRRVGARRYSFAAPGDRLVDSPG